MKNLILAAMAAPVLAGCVVHAHRHEPRTVHAPPPPPRPAASVSVSYGWNHVRYSVWTEYYSCAADEVYYLENSGYDDDDVLVLCHIARRARVPLRWVALEYDRCGRSLYTVSMVYGLPWDAWYCHEVPRGYGCPPSYARAYGHYWRGERTYLSNADCHALIHLQIGVRYYGYGHAAYFDDHSRGHGFRTMAVRDYQKCGSGMKTYDEKVIVKKERAWEAPDVKEWDKKREVERQQIKVKVTPNVEREEHQKAVKASEERKHLHVEAAREVQVLKVKREEDDRKNPPSREEKRPLAQPEAKPSPAPGRAPGPPEAKPAPGPARTPGPPEAKPSPGPARAPEPKRVPAVEEPRKAPPGPERKPAEKSPPPAPERKPPPPPPPPPKAPPPPPPPPPKQEEKKGPPPSQEKKGDSEDKSKKK